MLGKAHWYLKKLRGEETLENPGQVVVRALSEKMNGKHGTRN